MGRVWRPLIIGMILAGPRSMRMLLDRACAMDAPWMPVVSNAISSKYMAGWPTAFGLSTRMYRMSVIGPRSANGMRMNCHPESRLLRRALKLVWYALFIIETDTVELSLVFP